MPNSSLPTLSGPSWGPASHGEPKQLIVMCHGIGGDGNQLIGFAPLAGAALPDAVFAAPGGPRPHHGGGREWFWLDELQPAQIAIGIREGAAALDGYIDARLKAYSLAPDAYAMVGFSQGAMTVLFAGLRRPVAPRAIVAISGALLDPASLAGEISNRAPVLLAHGELDRTVPAARTRDAERVLNAAGVPVQTVFSANLAHSIDEILLNATVTFLRQAFPTAG